MPTITLPQALALALDHHRAGRLAEAEAIYRQILAVDPQHADALNFLGVIASQTGRHDAAAELIRRAIAWAPNVAAYHSNLAETCRHLGCFEEAIAACRRALELDPTCAAASNNLGVALRRQGRFEEAAAAYRRALELRSDNAEFCNNLGVALSELGRMDDAVEAYRRSLALDPDSATTLNNLATALQFLGQMDEATAAYRRALKLKPDYATAHKNFANLLLDSELDAAERHARRALELQPAGAEMHSTLGVVLQQQGRLEDAIAHYRRAVELRPDSASLHSNLVYAMLFDPKSGRAALYEEWARWRAQHEAPLRAEPHRNRPDPERRLRIGYVSPDFCEHVIGRNLIPLFAAHDHGSFEILCYFGGARADALTERFRALADHWRDTLGITDAELAERIRADRVDILVDLAQHMSGSRLPVFVRRPAPVQVSFAGYPESAGLASIRHRISDRWLETDPMAFASGTGERVWPIDSFWCYDPCGLELDAGPGPAREDGAVTFGCLNNFSKINDRVLALWVQVLARVPDSQLMILSPEGSHRSRVVETLGRHGVEPGRVEFVSPRPRAEYMALYRRIDIALDTFPYNGHTTTLDALWMGVPVVSLVGEMPVARAGWSIMNNLGLLPEFVAQSEADYVRNAAELAADRTQLVHWRETLRDRMKASVLMDAPHFARQIEDAYRGMWREWCAR